MSVRDTVGNPTTEDPAAGDAAAREAVGGEAAGDGAEAGAEGAPATLRRDLEAVLMVVDQPVSEYDLARAMDVPVTVVVGVLESLSREYTEQGRGFDLRAVAEGWRVYTRPECADVVEHFLREGQEVRLTQAALETMAVVAYRQPVSRGRVSAVRGVNCDGVMRTLVLRGLIEEAGHDSESGALLYRTTSYFLERLGLRGLDELPDLAPFLPDDIEGLDDTGEHT
ncbi:MULTISPECIES: SMC-Scp complex subunit ScpB [Nocardiopsis]|uniref:Chromosome segregation and condensation protein, ScpB n=1 Tax=Nocardiopsis dassonvillei (strain ATCC 23218 / DSM 43111 / CIP 107115 / JCM 7437 / KCTC 9190 / NBRC 14626 / NCTC 10488 / NRRL B-5397 / IMRU 509) TaxID=446468 RepID=D7B0L2_NOCDD|nr:MULTISPECIES: SMC-Scp complex subunit ScpB [Nocardiopsis]ADH66419.1 chromosome segregation and condensation protein, ScpB [Nocardiopsis dassonvillei subsp. dassonvillei DSM 43111]VEI92440.1 Segregation and condensation protein B homolog [Nocardiopsis dassonvillei]